MFKSPLVLPLTLIFAGVLAFMATTGVLPAEVLRFWPIIFVVLGLVGLVSLSDEEIMGESMSTKKSVAQAAPEGKKRASKSKKRSAKKSK